MSFHKNHQKEVPLLKIKWWFVRVATIPVEKIWTSHKGAFGMTALQTPVTRYEMRLVLFSALLSYFVFTPATVLAISSSTGGRLNKPAESC